MFVCYSQSGKFVLPVNTYGQDTCQAELPYGVAGCMAHVVMTYSCFAALGPGIHEEAVNSAQGHHTTSLKMVHLCTGKLLVIQALLAS